MLLLVPFSQPGAGQAVGAHGTFLNPTPLHVACVMSGRWDFLREWLVHLKPSCPHPPLSQQGVHGGTGVIHTQRVSSASRESSLPPSLSLTHTLTHTQATHTLTKRRTVSPRSMTKPVSGSSGWGSSSSFIREGDQRPPSVPCLRSLLHVTLGYTAHPSGSGTLWRGAIILGRSPDRGRGRRETLGSGAASGMWL